MMEIPKPVAALLDRLEAHGAAAYVVGGCVRDSIMGVAPHDWDACSAAMPETVMQLFPRSIPTGLQHGTVTVLTEAGPVEVTTFRAETGYADHRRPGEVAFLPEIDGDLARRDFTINAMAYSPRRGLVDLYGGQEDLQNGVIRCVGDPDRRFAEDALRMLRALRFSARLHFEIEAQTAAAMRRHAGELRYLAGERVYAELRGLLAADGAALAETYPELLRTALPRLSLPLSRHAMRTWRTQLGDAGVDILLRWAAYYCGMDTVPAVDLLDRLRAEEREAAAPLAIGGKELCALGIPPGRGIGELLRALRACVQGGTVQNTEGELLALAKSWYEQGTCPELPTSNGHLSERTRET